MIATAIYYFEQGTNYYLFPAYPTMFAVGAVFCERLLESLTRIWLAAAIAVSAIYAPVALPILAPADLPHYLEFTHLKPEPIEAAGVGAPLTQSLSDELGWRDLERKVAAAFHELSAQDRARVAIITANYGEAAALDVYGRPDALPPALSGHNQYFLWGPRGYDGSLILHVGGSMARWREVCGSVEEVTRFGGPYVMPYENDRPIFICRDLRMPLADLWSKLKRFR